MRVLHTSELRPPPFARKRVYTGCRNPCNTNCAASRHGVCQNGQQVISPTPSDSVTCNDLCNRRASLLFHSGIFIDGRSGRFCRPTFFEALRAHPGVRVTLAHLGWPWTDEAIAVGLIDRIHGVPNAQAAFRFDLSFGPPPPYRLEVLRRALDVLGPGLLQYASDCFLPCSGAEIRERKGWLADLLDELGLDVPARNAIWSGTAAAWLGREVPLVRLASPVASQAHSAQALDEGAPWSWKSGSGPLQMRRFCC